MIVGNPLRNNLIDHTPVGIITPPLESMFVDEIDPIKPDRSHTEQND